MKTWEEITDTVRKADSAEGLLVQGNGTLVRGALAGNAIRLGEYEGIDEYNESERLLVVKSGTTLSRIKKILRERGQRLAFDPPDYAMFFGSSKRGGATIGGVIAADLNGGGCLFWGSAKDHVLGMRICSGKGEVYKAGGKTVKNVSGFDIAKMMVGSRSRLGIILELNLKVVPLANEERTLCYEEKSIEKAGGLARDMMRTPFGVVQATYKGGILYISLEGGSLDTIIKCLPKKPDAVWESEKSATFWDGIRDGNELCDMLKVTQGGEVWQVLSAQTVGVLFLDRFLREFTDGEGYFEWSGARIWIVLPAENMVRFKQFVTKMQAETKERIALKPFEVSKENRHAFIDEVSQEKAMWKRLQKIHDPRGIFKNGG